GSVRLALGVGADRDGALAYRQVGTDKAQGVVAIERQRALPDRIAADILSRGPREHSRKGISGQKRTGSDLEGERRIGGSVRLALGVGGDGDGALTNRQAGADEAEGVVAAERQRALLDRIAAHLFTRRARQRAGQGITRSQRAGADLVGERWV